MKRGIDIVAASIALVLSAPVMAVIALSVRISMGRPVLFRQERPGQGERPFELVKFRTMANKTDSNGEPLPDAQRLTRLGLFLRQTSLDELPTFWNVLRGEMSLVGPRPLLMKYLPLYTKEQRRRHEVRPGITGWAQINGRNAVSWEEKFAMDVWYVENRSMWLDIRILALTFKKVFQREGINREGRATVDYFTGSENDARS